METATPATYSPANRQALLRRGSRPPLDQVAVDFSGADVRLELVMPQLIAPAWSWTSTFSLALPLVLTTLAGQYLPGMAVLKVSGYDNPVRPIIAVNSLASLERIEEALA